MTDDVIVPAIGARIREIREQRGLSQTDLGDLCGLKPNRISNYETGLRVPPLAAIIALCRGLGCSADDLLGIAPKDDEKDYIEKFRRLDEKAKHIVRAVIDSEHHRIEWLNRLMS